ncbi:MAG: hypothetical protein ACREYF_16225 [Gammaproteobacteria bacterium]
MTVHMTARFKTFAAAVMLATAGSASAATLDFLPISGNSSLFFTSFDFVAGRSYFSQINAVSGPVSGGVRMDDILNNPTSSWTFSLPGLNTFYAASSAANVLFGAGAADTLGTGQVLGRRQLSSFSAGGSGPTSTNTQINNAGINLETFHNSFQDPNTPAGPGLCNTSPCTATSPSDLSYAGGGNWGATWGFPSGFSHSTQLSSPDLDFYLLTPSNSQGFPPATVQQLALLRGHLDIASNTFTITAVPVPELALASGFYFL